MSTELMEPTIFQKLTESKISELILTDERKKLAHNLLKQIFGSSEAVCLYSPEHSDFYSKSDNLIDPYELDNYD